ncbi:BTAD domain-containing putative transcriptional regulator [Nocardia sp. NPDC051030]|uniref:AfsR/SARP family transcriptional regulator n=1 Tax=Nocardia sp. NPDC051030 TaxID=3155162 RepID=UPI00344877D3
MRFGILGPVEVRRGDGSPLAVGGPQVRSLLALLAVDAGRVVSRERLIDGLYGEEPPGDAGHALQSQVSRLRRALRNGVEGGELVESSAAGYRLAVEPEAVDAHRFARLAEGGRKALREKDFAAAAALLDEAMALWRGAALADVRDAPFADVQVARLTEARLAAAEDRAEVGLALGEHQGVVAELPDLVAAHPLRERTRALLMRGLYAAGRQAEALELFEQGRRLFAEELGADPGAELAEAHMTILRADAPSSGAAQTRRLPAQFTSFVGRDAEIAQLVPLLAQTRLVTLTGPGGTGKTRLALEAGTQFRGEVCFVALAPLADGADIAEAIADALGSRDTLAHSTSGPRDAETRVLAALADRPLLLILDNCEQVILDAARLTHRLLLGCPGLRVLATSREALSITGETVLQVGQLPVADTDAALTEQLRSPAVHLFADRATAARPGFTVDAGTIGTVRRICARLDGLPLAIELAAARLRSLDLEEIDARLSDRFRLLGRGDRTAEPRHQTLQAVVAWSWDLLDPAEQLLAQRFTVFAGGATAEDVQHVCALDDADELLPSLAEKSLLQVTGNRYRMLETIREFAHTRLTESGAPDPLLRAHAEYFTALAEHSEPLLRGNHQLTHLTRLGTHHDNLQAALRWSVHSAPHLALRLIAAQAWYWWLSGRPGDAPQLARDLLPHLDSDLQPRPNPGPMPPSDSRQPPQRGPTLQLDTGLPQPDSSPVTRLNDAEAVEAYALCVAVGARGGALSGAEVERATAAVGRLETPLRRPYLVFLLAVAGGLLTSSAEQQRRLFGPDAWSQAFTRLGEGLRMLMSGNPIDAEPELRTALEDFRVTGDRWAIASTLDKLAAIADWRGDRQTSLALIEEALTLNDELGAVADSADLLNRHGDILARGGLSECDLDAARADYERAADLARSIGVMDLRANALRGLGDIARTTDRDEARGHYMAALALPPDESVGAVEARARSLIGLGWINISDGAVAQALYDHRTALQLALDHRLRHIAAGAAVGLAGASIPTAFATTADHAMDTRADQSADRNAERAATLLGAATGMRGLALEGDTDIATVTAAARAVLGDKRFENAYRLGTEMPPAEVLSLAWVG